ncbi:MAG: hypothetical protein JWO48_1221 [Bryobacterales bacterium]|nr:hypothetical protein [Bryobacterales bacterium]
MITRREVLKAGAAAAVASGAACRRALAPGPRGNAAVSILRATSYRADLLDLLRRGAAACNLQVRGKRVLLKPNLVEFESGAVIHTEVEILAAAVALFESLGAREIIIGEGPGHRRDAMFLAEEAGYRAGIPRFEERFVDLNRDDVARVAPFADTECIYLPRTALAADLVVSVARMKTHHWAGATLSMKNLFGVVPGAVYGWPKNHLHHVGIGRAVAELYQIFPRSFAIVDGIVGMEGNGPVQGRARACGALVMGSNLAAVDATCCRIMGIDPAKIEYLQLVSVLGHVDADRIEQRGESIAALRTPFALLPQFEHLRLG